MAASHVHPPTLPFRVLGGLGVLGGVMGLAAFAGFPDSLNLMRLILWYLGSIAVALAAYPAHAAMSRRPALVATIPLVLASAWAMLWILLGTGRESPSSAAFGLVGFWVELAGWLAAALFGFVAARLAVLWRPASFALAIGSVMTIAGMDRLGLTSSDRPTILGEVALAGFVMVASAWVLLGAQIAVGRAQPRPTGVDALHQTVQA